DAPAAKAAVSSPLAIRGSANFWPFEATLVAQLKDASGAVLAMQPVMVQSPDAGQGGPWSEEIRFTPPATAQEGTLEILEPSAKDGSILTFASVKVQLAPGAQPGTALTFEHPNDGAAVTLPLHVAFGGARGDEQLALRLRLADGTVHEQVVRADLGYVVETLAAPSVPGAATLEVARGDGTVLAQRELRVAAPEETQTVKVAWAVADGDQVTLQTLSVPRTPRVATAALDELLWGPVADEAGYGTALPTPSDVLSYAGREPGWGARVRLLKLTIEDGVALANFSPELRAYGGGAARASMIRKQIETTLRQFPSVQQVVIAVDGQTEGVLEP
ncbi:MAG: GerMN domain-containing protein, partial [Chloroflexota bacterium]|nr:GerMN domain-containing protein [Chloroflexota bacterium]